MQLVYTVKQESLQNWHFQCVIKNKSGAISVRIREVIRNGLALRIANFYKRETF